MKFEYWTLWAWFRVQRREKILISLKLKIGEMENGTFFNLFRKTLTGTKHFSQNKSVLHFNLMRWQTVKKNNCGFMSSKCRTDSLNEEFEITQTWKNSNCSDKNLWDMRSARLVKNPKPSYDGHFEFECHSVTSFMIFKLCSFCWSFCFPFLPLNWCMLNVIWMCLCISSLKLCGTWRFA